MPALIVPTSKPCKKFPTPQNNTPLITKINKPNVMMVIGNVKMVKIGLINTFAKPITTAAAAIFHHLAAITRPPSCLYKIALSSKIILSSAGIWIISLKSCSFLFSFRISDCTNLLSKIILDWVSDFSSRMFLRSVKISLVSCEVSPILLTTLTYSGNRN